MATLALFLVSVFSLLCFEPIQTAHLIGEPYSPYWFVTLISHMVSHGGWDHLLGNFIFGLPYMLYLEWRLKSARLFVRSFFAIGLGALAGQVLMSQFSLFPSVGLIGSSGAIFGLVAMALMAYDGPRPVRVLLKFLVCFHLWTQFKGMSFSLVFPVGVGYAAHFFGIVCGIALSFYLFPSSSSSSSSSKRASRVSR